MGSQFAVLLAKSLPAGRPALPVVRSMPPAQGSPARSLGRQGWLTPAAAYLLDFPGGVGVAEVHCSCEGACRVLCTVL